MIRGLFVGVDRYSDPGIRDLVGAARDATALWALFVDTIPTLQAELLTNDKAGLGAVNVALQSLVGQATDDDTVIVSFSGHGTHDHRLVLHDTQKFDLVGSSLPMSDLADVFKRSKAKIILFVLDCCFSGGAPAKVLEDSPAPKDPGSTLESMAGRGRIIIAASNKNEVAYESPTSRHGLLTKALIDVLISEATSVDIISAMAEVMARTRTSAAEMGIVQTPVLLGHVEGGLVFPSFRKGLKFAQAFPEASRVRVSGKISELEAFSIPATILSEWSVRFPEGLNSLQLEAINEYRVSDGASLLVIAPTSSGKTFIGEMSAARAISQGQKAVFLLPYRALVNEKYDLFVTSYGIPLQMRVIRCTGDYSDETGLFIRGKYDLAVLTFEMFVNLAVSEPSILNQLGLVVLDEAQFVVDPGRGISVELLLTLLIDAKHRGVSPQLVALSAVIGDTNHFDEWLGCRALISQLRPVPLIEGVLDRNGLFQYRDVDAQPREVQLLSPAVVRVRGERPSAQDVIVPLVRQLLAGKEKIIIFRNQRGAAEGCAHYLANDLSLPPATNALAALPRSDLSSTSRSIRDCLNHGTAFHNTNLTREEKQAVERAFRATDNELRVLAATTTVAAGINTPASTVIIAEQEFVGEDGRPFTIAEYKNMAGRAGRLGFNEIGRSVILANDPVDRNRLFDRYVLGELEPIGSSFQAEDLETWIVRLLAQTKYVMRDQVVQLLLNTYGGFLANRQNSDWSKNVRLQLEQLLAKMTNLGLLEEEAGFVQLTLLGRACGGSSLSFRSAMRFVQLVKSVGPSSVTQEQLIAIVQALPESDGGYTPMFKRGQKEAVRPGQAAQRFGQDVIRVLQRYVQDSFDYYARCKRAAILWDWIRGVPVEMIESTYTANPFQGKISYGDIRKFADNTRFHLRAAHQIANILLIGGAADEPIDTVLKQLEVGLPVGALNLLDLPIVLTRGEYMLLHDRSLRSADDVWRLSDEDLIQLLGAHRAREMARLRPS